MSKISGCSSGISCSKNINFTLNFEELKNPIQETSKKSKLILEYIPCEKLRGETQMGFPKNDLKYEEVYNWLINRLDVSVNEIKKSRHKEQRLIELTDDTKFQLVNQKKKSIHKEQRLIELTDVSDNEINRHKEQRLDVSVNEIKKSRHKEQRLIELTDDTKSQLVNQKKKKVIEKDLLVNSNCPNMEANSSSVKVVPLDDNAMGTQRPKVPFHMNWIPKPQDVYKILVNNVNQPFQHVWLQTSKDGSRLIHPLEKHSVFDFVNRSVSNTNTIKPPPVETAPFKLVQDVKDLKELVKKLQGTDEFAVDLEHNQYRSFQGLTCLMQISTRTEDFIVDTLKLRVHIGPYMREIFKDPTKRKVMHGADKDIVWLQRDFGIYVCNMFDTGQASRVLKMERNRLDYLLLYFCGVAANKEYQTADWRLRPLTDEMLRYAREDTHYLLYVYDLMKKRLLSSSPDPDNPDALLVEVYQRSFDVCMQLYQKDILTESSYLNIYGLHEADLNGQQLSIVAALCEWRDIVARAEDESTGYVLPNKTLIEIAKKMPVTNEDLRSLLTSNHPHIERSLTSIVSIIQNSLYNASQFEDVARRLKEEYLEMKWLEEASGSTGVVGAHNYSNIVGNQSGKKAGSVLAKVKGNYQLGGWNPMNRSGFTNTKLQNLDENIRVQKDPSCGFKAVPGNAAGNRKLDLDTNLSSSFQKYLQTSNETIIKEGGNCKGSVEVVPFGYAAGRKEVNLKEEKGKGKKVMPEKRKMKKSKGGCKGNVVKENKSYTGWVGGTMPFLGIKLAPTRSPPDIPNRV